MNQPNDFIPVSKPYFWGDESRYVAEAIGEGWISSKGRFLNEFEAAFSSYLGVKHAVAVSSGTTALHLAVDVLGIGEGDEVIVPDFVMIAPVYALLYQKAIPVPVDADSSWNIDPAGIERKITPRTKAILVVHTYGLPADMEAIGKIAARFNLPVIEDCAEALGSEINGVKVGRFSDVACFSFYANKVITTGEGGMLVTNRDDLFDLATAKRNMCFGDGLENQYTHEHIGFSYRMTNLQAAVGLAQMSHIDEATERKIRIGEKYGELLAGVRGLTLPPESDNSTNVYWAYGILVDEDFGISRQEIQGKLKESGIATRRFFTPIHRQPVCKELIKDDDFPVSDKLWRQGLYLPTFVGMSDEQIARIAGRIIELGNKK